VSIFALVLLAAAVLLLAAAEWPRLAALFRLDTTRLRSRERRKSRLRVVEGEHDNDSDDFARSVERDLAQLPTYDPHESDKRRR
jgi:hypothetical protein